MDRFDELLGMDFYGRPTTVTRYQHFRHSPLSGAGYERTASGEV